MSMCSFLLDSSFPMNFSVMTTVRAVKGSQAFLLSLYDSQVCIMWHLTHRCWQTFIHQDVELYTKCTIHPTNKQGWTQNPIYIERDYLDYLTEYLLMKTISILLFYHRLLSLCCMCFREHSSWVWRSAALLFSSTRTMRVNHLQNSTPPLGKSTWLMASG